MCEHKWIKDFVVVEDECNEAGDLMVFGARVTPGEVGAVCELCALVWGTTDEFHHDLLYTINFLREANFPKNVTK